MQGPLFIGIGDNCIDRYLDEGIQFPGGSALNFAVHARRNGVPAAYIGCVSSSPLGDELVAAVVGENVGTDLIARYDGVQSTTDVRVDERGNREFGRWVPVPQPITIDDAARTALRGARLAHTGHSSNTEANLPELAQLTRVSFDFSYRGLDYAGELLPHVHAAAFSAAGLSEQDALDFAREVRARGPEVVMVTRGPGATIVVDGDVEHLQPSDQTAPVVDTLGAGDAFIAAYHVHRSRDTHPAEAAASAAAYAAVVCGYRGAFGSGSPLQTEEATDD